MLMLVDDDVSNNIALCVMTITRHIWCRLSVLIYASITARMHKQLTCAQQIVCKLARRYVSCSTHLTCAGPEPRQV